MTQAVPVYELVRNGHVYEIWSALNGRQSLICAFSGGIDKIIVETAKVSREKHGAQAEQCFIAGVMLGLIQCATKENENAQSRSQQPVQVPDADRGDVREPDPSSGGAAGGAEGEGERSPSPDEPHS